MTQITKKSLNYYAQCTERHYSHPTVKAFAKPKVKWILSKINLKNRKVLEVGAGNGYFSKQLIGKCDLSVLDISKHQLKRNPAKKKYEGSVYRLPFENNSFNVVLCSNLLHHLHYPQKAVNEMERVAKEYVVLSEPNRSNPLIFIGALLRKRERLAVQYSKGFLERIAKKARLKPKYHTYIGGLVMPNGTPVFLLPVAGAKSKNRFSFFQIFICKKSRK